MAAPDAEMYWLSGLSKGKEHPAFKQMTVAIAQLKADGLWHTTAARMAEIEAGNPLSVEGSVLRTRVQEDLGTIGARFVQDGPLCDGCWAAPCVCELDKKDVCGYIKQTLGVMNGEPGKLDFSTLRVLLISLRNSLALLEDVYKWHCGENDGDRMIYSAADGGCQFEDAENLLCEYGLLHIDNGQIVDRRDVE